MAYWIGWIATFIIGFVIFRVIVRRDYLRHGKLGSLAVISEFLIFGIHANLPYLYLDQPWPFLPPLPDNPLQRWVGLMICLIGVLATILIMARLGFGTSTGQLPPGLQISGPYKITRNPQLIAYTLALIGAGVLFPSIQTLAWILLFAAISYLMVITEEEHLLRLFGHAYQEYCQHVPRFIIHWNKLDSSSSRTDQ
jgi:protein-S-isoprenylcysteine O-methyltransferase Ste14